MVDLDAQNLPPIDGDVEAVQHPHSHSLPPNQVVVSKRPVLFTLLSQENENLSSTDGVLDFEKVIV